MNRRALVLAVSLLALPIAARAQTASGLYVSIGAGINFMQEEDVDAQLAASPSTHIVGEVTTNPGPAVVGAFGWATAKGFRLEVEGNYRTNAIDSLSPAFTGDDGLGSEDFDIGAEKKYGVMTNALYEVHGTRIAPYFGAGIGGQFVHEPAVNHTANGGVVVAVAASTVGSFAYQLIAGTAFPIRKASLSITAEYRLLSLVGSRESTATVTIPGLGTIDVVDSSSHDKNHSVVFGIRYVFGG